MPARLHHRQDVIAKLGEVFRMHGYEGASLTHITQSTGLGKGSLYHAFPNGKSDMAEAVLQDIHAWFESNVFAPLDQPHADVVLAVEDMLRACDTYFCGGGRVCLVGVFALADTRDRFHVAVKGYFLRWHKTLERALARAGLTKTESRNLSEDILAGIQGGLVMARALDDAKVFTRELARLKERVRQRFAV
jgi:AcrR family transcriptional regulator